MYIILRTMIICICIKFWFFIQVYLDNKKKHSNVFFDNTFTITSIFHNYFKKNMKNTKILLILSSLIL